MLDYYRYKEVLELFMCGEEGKARCVLMELQAKHIAIADENSILKMQLQEYEEILYLSKNLIFDGTCYWLLTGSIKQGPFCDKCYSSAGLLVRLLDGKPGLRCPMCSAVCGEHHEEREPLSASGQTKILPFAR